MAWLRGLGSDMGDGSQLTPADWVVDPVCWPILDEDEREHQVASLQRWLSWLIERYSLDFRSVPTCRKEHGALVEELSSLRIAWVTANVPSVSDGSYTQLAWHSDFAQARERVAGWIAGSGCRVAEHRPPQARSSA